MIVFAKSNVLQTNRAKQQILPLLRGEPSVKIWLWSDVETTERAPKRVLLPLGVPKELTNSHQFGAFMGIR